MFHGKEWFGSEQHQIPIYKKDCLLKTIYVVNIFYHQKNNSIITSNDCQLIIQNWVVHIIIWVSEPFIRSFQRLYRYYSNENAIPIFLVILKIPFLCFFVQFSIVYHRSQNIHRCEIKYLYQDFAISISNLILFLVDFLFDVRIML